MSLWDEITKPVNKVLDSSAFKAVLPVQAIGQEAVKFGSGLTGINGGRGLNPADQYTIGAGTGAVLGAGSALAGSGAPSGAGAGAPPSASPGASSWESHAPVNRHTSDDSDQIAQYYHKKYPDVPAPFGPPQYPRMP